MKVTVLGAAGEVGRSGFLVNSGSTNLLLDYGIKPEQQDIPVDFPVPVKPNDIDSVIITHAHSDHSACIPSLFINDSPDVYATPPTIDLCELIIEDVINKDRKKGRLPFGKSELKNMIQNANKISFKQPITKDGTTFVLQESGHMIGGSTVLVESEGKRLLYTGDIRPSGSRIVREADLNIDNIDLLITESTYSSKVEKSRKQSEQDLVSFANEIIDNGGVLLIPVPGVERAQNIACTFSSANFEHPIIMDGKMALKANEIMSKHPEYMLDPTAFTSMLDNLSFIRDDEERGLSLVEPCVVLLSGSTLKSAKANYYLQKLAFKRTNGIALVTHQHEGTPSWRLSKKGDKKISIHGMERKVKARVREFDFSDHGDRNELFNMISKIQGNPKVLTVHGDADDCQTFAQEIHDKFGLDARAAETRQTITI